MGTTIYNYLTINCLSFATVGGLGRSRVLANAPPATQCSFTVVSGRFAKHPCRPLALKRANNVRRKIGSPGKLCVKCGPVHPLRFRVLSLTPSRAKQALFALQGAVSDTLRRREGFFDGTRARNAPFFCTNLVIDGVRAEKTPSGCTSLAPAAARRACRELTAAARRCR